MKRHIPSLNGLRAICVLIVIAYHLFQHHFLADHVIIKYSRFLLLNGPLAVNVFFIISGFLITTLLVKEKEQTCSVSLKAFYWRRTVRIFPAYYFLLGVYALLQFFNYFQINTAGWISALTYTRQFVAVDNNETAHLWSLSVEEVFYLIWPMLFIAVNGKKSWLVAALVGVVVIGRIFQFSYPVPLATNTIFSTADALLIGCLFSLKQKEIYHWMKTQQLLGTLLLPLLLLSVLIYNYFFSKGLNTHPVFSWGQKISYAFFGNIGLITNLLIAVGVLFSIHTRNVWFKFLNLPVMEYVGKLSYSIYLWQQLFTSDREIWHQTPLALLLVYIAGASIISYYLIELPFMRLRSKISSRVVEDRLHAIEPSLNRPTIQTVEDIRF